MSCGPFGGFFFRSPKKEPLGGSLGGGFKYFLCSSLFGEDSHFDSYFSNGLVQPPTSSAKEGNVEDLAWNLKKVEEFLAKAQEEASPELALSVVG